MKIARLSRPLVFLGLWIASQSNAATLAIIDSGVDNEHDDLTQNFWVNPGEEIGNGKDDDWNAYVDDIFGWNFADRNNLIIDRTFIGSFSETPARFFQLQEKILRGTITPDEQQWVKDVLANKEAVTELQTFGNFVHGTHVAGIAQAVSPSANILALKIIPTKVRLPLHEIDQFVTEFALPQLQDGDVSTHGIRQNILNGLLFALAKAQGIVMSDVGRYLHRQKIDVANGSFGLSVEAAKGIVSRIARVLLGKNPDPAALEALSRSFVLNVIESQRTLVNSSKDTFFVFAAGNDGSDNDTFPVSPANIKSDNTISVAATDNTSHIASFSNFGATTVDVAAPGVAIHSSIPGQGHMKLSGTSQAAPFVAGVATEIRSLNPNLKPADVKQILMATVDTYDFLEGRVASRGIVNATRALAAAQGSLSMSLKDALEAAWQTHPQQEQTISLSATPADDVFALALPIGIHFNVPQTSRDSD